MLPNSYQAYVDNSVVGSSPTQLIVALYEGAIEATRQAARCLETGDVWGRSKAVSKAHNILTELYISVDCEKGGELSSNLRRLYAYMQSRLLDGHAKKSGEALAEVDRLLSNLLEAWRVVAAKSARLAEPAIPAAPQAREEEGMPALPYGGYYQPVDTFSQLAYSF